MDPRSNMPDLVFGSPGVGQWAAHVVEVARAGDADELEDEESAGA